MLPYSSSGVVSLKEPLHPISTKPHANRSAALKALCYYERTTPGRKFVMVKL